MTIAKGVSLGPYEIVAQIGSGGMGEVWRARDGRIGRDVAVKILPDSFTDDEEPVRRFEQEARAAGALNHPGLVTIFDVGTAEGAPYIVMELLEGETLRDAIGDDVPKPLPLRRAIDYALQVASALAVAHERGIIHRDLKPENLFVTSDRRVKILDFGLAKLAEASTDSDRRGTTKRHLTSAGIVVGTPAYMSPEQCRAQPLDHRTDIFSLGAVMYEMITGRQAFDGASAVEIMHGVLATEPPPMAGLVPNVPPALEAIVRHCLEKDPRERFQSARDLAFQLRMLVDQNSIAESRATVPPPRRLPLRAMAIATAAVLALAAAGYAAFRAGATRSAAPERAYRQLTFGDSLEMFPTLAPDGKSFAYVSSDTGNRDIYVQRVDGRTAINITADSPDDDSQPAFSPDGEQIAFRSEREGGGIFVMGVTGESVRRLTDFGYNPSWSPDGTRIVVATDPVELRPHVHGRTSALWLIDTRSGARRAIVQTAAGGPDFGRGSDAVQPSWSPNGHRIAFWGISNSAGRRDLWTIDPDAPQPKATAVRVTDDPALDWNPVWSPDGRYLYFGSDRDGTMNLWRVAIDEKTGERKGEPEAVSLPAVYAANFSFSQQGTIAYTTATQSSRLLAIPFDAATAGTGEPRVLFGSSQEILTFEASPDGTQIAFTTTGSQEDLFVADRGGRVRQLTDDEARDRGVTWSPDGKTLYFYSNRGGAHHLWSIRVDGSNLTRVTNERDLKDLGEPNIFMPELSPDGRMLVGQTAASGVLVHLVGGGTSRVTPFGRRGVQAPKWSPDGSEIVAEVRPAQVIGVYSLATGRFEQVLDRGMSPDWLPGGRRIVFFEKRGIGVLDLDRRLVTVQPFTPPAGVELDNLAVWPRLARDGSTLYVRQTLEHGDIWMGRLARE